MNYNGDFSAYAAARWGNRVRSAVVGVLSAAAPNAMIAPPAAEPAR